MNSDTFHADAPADGPPDPAAGTAAIHPVTPEMMDEAAHRAAQLADDVAHHVVPAPAPADAPAPDRHDAEAPAAAATAEADGAATAALDRAGEPAADLLAAAEPALVATADAVDDAVRGIADHVEATLARTAAAAEPRLSGGTEVLGRYHAALLGMVQTNLAATGEFFAALVKAKSLPEVVAINTDHMRRQFDALTSQGRELANLTQTLTFAAFKPPAGSPRDGA